MYGAPNEKLTIILAIAMIVFLITFFTIKAIYHIRKWKRDKEEYEYFKRENDKYRNK